MAATMNIDQEWENFISSEYNDDDISSDGNEYSHLDINPSQEYISANLTMDIINIAPKATNIYISTKTKIAYLNKIIDLKSVFLCSYYIIFYTY